MDLDWARLARELAAARKRTGRTQKQVAAELGDIGLATVQAMERESRKYARVTPNHRAAARLYGWTDDSIGRVLSGEDPVLQSDGLPSAAAEPATPAVTPPATPTAATGLPQGTPQRIRKALSGGEAIDTELIPLDPDDPESGLVMMIKQGDKQLSEEQMERVMKRWVQLTEIAREIYRKDPPEEGGNP